MLYTCQELPRWATNAVRPIPGRPALLDVSPEYAFAQPKAYVNQWYFTRNTYESTVQENIFGSPAALQTEYLKLVSEGIENHDIALGLAMINTGIFLDGKYLRVKCFKPDIQVFNSWRIKSAPDGYDLIAETTSDLKDCHIRSDSVFDDISVIKTYLREAEAAILAEREIKKAWDGVKKRACLALRAINIKWHYTKSASLYFRFNAGSYRIDVHPSSGKPRKNLIEINTLQEAIELAELIESFSAKRAVGQD